MTTPMQKAAMALEKAIEKSVAFNGGAVRFPNIHHADICGAVDTDDLARAVLATLLPPSPEMLAAARDWSAAKYGKPIGNDAATGCFTAMINAGCE